MADRTSGGPEIGPAPEARLPQAGLHTRCAACLVRDVHLVLTGIGT
jgi:hypothetical protein